MGFGAAVIQRLCKTSAKKNLYWEIKDRVIEEAFNGVRVDKVTKKVRVYGVDSTKAVRARLIEILMERVRYHKDKFICPILHSEMSAMEVKKNGKVEHSDKTHDDQVFSYLMALYVWYDGKNLIENFGIRKTTIKTDEDVELEEDIFEDAIEKKEKLSIDNSIDDSRDEILETLEWVEKSVGIKSSLDMKNEQYLNRLELREMMMVSNPEVSDQIMVNTGINVSPNQQYAQTRLTTLPENIFDPDFDDEPDPDSNGQFSLTRSPVCGNLADQFNLL